MNKFDLFYEEMSKRYLDIIHINLSPSSSFRCRCEFGYKHNSYTMYDNQKNILYLKNFKYAANSIQKVMPDLLFEINRSLDLKDKLFQINFRSNDLNKIMVTLIYHKNISNKLKDLVESLSKLLNINIILRSKNFINFTSSKFLESTIDEYKVYQTDNCFYQPNKYLLNKMITKVKQMIEFPNDLLELYCGIGTFTLPLSKYFNQILATESNREANKCLIKALEKNKIKNIHPARISSDEVVMLFDGKKFNRMHGKSLSSFNFSHVLVDPPRSGLTKEVIQILKKFKNIIYISCNPKTYFRDVDLLKEYKINKIEIFDQFPNTEHIEIVSLLSLR